MTERDPAGGIRPRLGQGRHSLRTRLMVWNAAILAVLLGVLGLVTRSLVRSMMLTSVDRELMRSTQPHVTPRPPGAPRPGQPPGPPAPNGPPPGVGAPGEGPPPGLPPGPGGVPAPPGELDPALRPAAAPLPRGEGRPGPPLPPGGEMPPRGPMPSGAAAGPPDGSEGRPFEPPYPVLMLDTRGKLIGPPGESTPYDVKAAARAAAGHRVFSHTTLESRPFRVLSRPIPERGAPDRVAQAAYPLTEVNRALAGLNRALLALAPLALLFAALGGAILTGRVLNPVRQMAQAAGRIGAEELSRRLPVVGKDEFGELAATFNAMLQRLELGFREKEELVEQLRRFTADASHELRTPLAVIKANTSLCLQGQPTEEEYRQSVVDIDGAATSMTRLVFDLLLLARSDSGRLGQDRIVLPIRDVLERAAARASGIGEAPVQVRLPEEELCVEGNEEELGRLFTNLLENALRYTPGDGRVTLAARRNGERVEVAVADTGAGIAPEHLPHLGERFYRVDPSRSRPDGGTGLGLSICKSIAEAHGGTIAFHSSVGVGTTVLVTLPAAS